MEEDQAKGNSSELVETELVLPSGTRIGHRDFNVYYRQSLRPLDVSPFLDEECKDYLGHVTHSFKCYSLVIAWLPIDC